MAESLPKRRLKQRSVWFYSGYVSLDELLKHANKLKEDYGVKDEDITVSTDAGYETADIYLQTTTLETDDEYAESCRKHEEIKSIIASNKAKNKDKEYQTFLRLKKKFEKNG